jgi:hypothetical protein
LNTYLESWRCKVARGSRSDDAHKQSRRRGGRDAWYEGQGAVTRYHAETEYGVQASGNPGDKIIQLEHPPSTTAAVAFHRSHPPEFSLFLFASDLVQDRQASYSEVERVLAPACVRAFFFP